MSIFSGPLFCTRDTLSPRSALNTHGQWYLLRQGRKVIGLAFARATVVQHRAFFQRLAGHLHLFIAAVDLGGGGVLVLVEVPVAEEAAQTLFLAAKLLARGNFVASEVLPLS